MLGAPVVHHVVVVGHCEHRAVVSRSREVALYRSGLAEAYAKAGDVDRACDQSMKVLHAVEGVNSARVDDRMVVPLRALRRYPDAPAVREVEERAHSLMRTA
jgi:hypothetical protein